MQRNIALQAHTACRSIANTAEWLISLQNKLVLKRISTKSNNAHSLWRVSGCHKSFLSAAKFIFVGQESSAKPTQALCEPL